MDYNIEIGLKTVLGTPHHFQALLNKFHGAETLRETLAFRISSCTPTSINAIVNLRDGLSKS